MFKVNYLGTFLAHGIFFISLFCHILKVNKAYKVISSYYECCSPGLYSRKQ